jgi:hypothetical protein
MRALSVSEFKQRYLSVYGCRMSVAADPVWQWKLPDAGKVTEKVRFIFCAAKAAKTVTYLHDH